MSPFPTFILFLLFCLNCCLLPGQESIKVDRKVKNQLEYLSFSGHENLKLVEELNTNFGYRAALVNAFDLSLNDFLARDESTETLEKRLDSTLNELNYHSAANVWYSKIHYSQDGLLSFRRVHEPEGLRKTGNSNFSEYPHCDPVIFNLLTGKPIESPEEFLTEEGSKYLTQLVRKTLVERAKVCCLTEPEEPYRVGSITLSEVEETPFFFTNKPESLRTPGRDFQGRIFFFYFSQDGLVIYNDDLSLRHLLAQSPYDEVLILYEELAQYVTKDGQPPIYQISTRKKQSLKNENLILLRTPEFVYNHPDEAEEFRVATPLGLKKGSVLKSLGKVRAFQRVEFSDSSGQVQRYWIKGADIDSSQEN